VLVPFSFRRQPSSSCRSAHGPFPVMPAFTPVVIQLDFLLMRYCAPNTLFFLLLPGCNEVRRCRRFPPATKQTKTLSSHSLGAALPGPSFFFYCSVTYPVNVRIVPCAPSSFSRFRKRSTVFFLSLSVVLHAPPFFSFRPEAPGSFLFRREERFGVPVN